MMIWNEINLVFLALLLAVAFLYSMVGHGGASGYLALMALLNFAPENMRVTALMLNIVVSYTAFYQYSKAGNMQWKLFMWLAIGSIPAAFIGGSIVIDPTVYKKILGVLLIIPAIRFFGISAAEKEIKKNLHPAYLVLIGIGIGFISGLIGIGGGIILSPILLLLSLSTMKETAAISALFITVNSFAGLAGNSLQTITFNGVFLVYVLFAFIGGLAGSYAGVNHFSSSSLRMVLALVLVAASLKLILT